MYPFAPKSTAKMMPGQFWAIPLVGSGYGCGVVLALKLAHNGRRDSRCFLAGLLDWFGAEPPTASNIRSREILRKGFAHIRTITAHGRPLEGVVEPWWDLPSVVEGRDDISTWGYNFINILADKLKPKTTGPAEPAAEVTPGP